MYSIGVDAKRHLIRLKLEGFWTAETVRAFAADEQAAVAGLRCAKGEHLVLADLSDFTIQSQEVVAMCKAFIDGATNSARKLALVAGAGLSRIQYKRVMGRDQMQLFETIAEAEAWLLEEPPIAPARPSASYYGLSPDVSGRL